MRYNNLILSGLIFLFGGEIPKLSAQSEVIKISALKSANYGVVYSLPLTTLILDVEFSKITLKAGPYARYAEKYLGVTDPIISEDQTYFSLDKIYLDTKGVPDQKETYLIEFKPKTSAPFVSLTQEGLICAINAEYAPEQQPKRPTNRRDENDALPTVSVRSTYTEEYLRAGSVAKMAEVAAKQIYKLRESRMDLLTGEAENVPRDGEAMKIVLQQLETQEKALTELFIGSSATQKQTATFEIEPAGNMENQIIFRFSKFLGVVDADDLSGNPVYLNLKKLDAVVETPPVNPKEKNPKPGADAKAIVYNIPGKASVEIFYGTRQMYKGEMQIAQFGTRQTLAASMFDDKKGPIRIYFYPETGAIKQIIQ